MTKANIDSLVAAQWKLFDTVRVHICGWITNVPNYSNNVRIPHHHWDLVNNQKKCAKRAKLGRCCESIFHGIECSFKHKTKRIGRNTIQSCVQSWKEEKEKIYESRCDTKTIAVSLKCLQQIRYTCWNFLVNWYASVAGIVFPLLENMNKVSLFEITFCNQFDLSLSKGKCETFIEIIKMVFKFHCCATECVTMQKKEEEVITAIPLQVRKQRVTRRVIIIKGNF